MTSKSKANVGSSDPKPPKPVCNAVDLKKQIAEKAKLRKEADGWEKSLEAHTKFVEAAKPRVDCWVPKTLLVSSSQARINANKTFTDQNRKIAQENAVMLKRLFNIYSAAPKVDSKYENKRDKAKQQMRTMEQTQADNRPAFDNPLAPSLSRVEQIRRFKSKVVKRPDLISKETMMKMEQLHRDFTKATGPSISRDEQLKWFEEQEAQMEKMSKYPLFWKVGNICSPLASRVMREAAGNQTTYAFMTIANEEGLSCRLVFELFAQLCPFTVASFERLCVSGYKGKAFEKLVTVRKPGSKNLGDSEGIDRMYWMCCPSTAPPLSEFVKYMEQECSSVKHDAGWLVTKPKGIATGEFYITVGPAPYLDKHCCAFGRISKDGAAFLEGLESSVDIIGYPKSPISVVESGLVHGAKEVE